MHTITVRHAEPDDYEAVHRIFSGPRAVAGTLQLPLQSVDRSRRRLAETESGMYRLVACADSEVVGTIGLRTLSNPRRRHVADIGMAVRDDWQDKGVGSALLTAALDLADNWLNVERVELTVYTDNAAAIGLYQKFGFAIEGTHSRYAFRAGTYVDAYTMARVQDGRH